MMEFLRAYKLPYKLYNFFNRAKLRHNVALYKRYGIKKKYFSSVSSQDFKGIDSPPNRYDEVDSRTEMPNTKSFQALDKKIQEELLSWSSDGYVVIKEFFSVGEIDGFNAEIDSLLTKKEADFSYRNKIMFAIHKSEILMNAGTNKKMLDVLSVLLDKKVELFQSINFLTGSQQRTHSDSIHMTTFPYGNLIAVWVALEDIKADSGPLHYYKGSHKLPYILNGEFDNVGSSAKLGDKTYTDYEDYVEKVVEKNKFKKEVFLAKKGDILVWHANLLHGGEAVTNSESTRKSMVFHYYAEDSICFHEVTQRPTLKK